MIASLAKQGGRRYVQSRSTAPTGQTQPLPANGSGGATLPGGESEYIVFARRKGRR